MAGFGTPVNGQYWTGHPAPYYNQQQYQMPYGSQGQYWGGQYMQPYYGYDQYGYGYNHPQMGYNNYNGQYPHFDANYWSGNLYQHNPMNIHQTPYHYQQAMYYPGHHGMYQPMYGHHPGLPYYRKPFGRGFLGGTGGDVAKGLLGAVLVGVIAGKVVKGK